MGSVFLDVSPGYGIIGLRVTPHNLWLQILASIYGTYLRLRVLASISDIYLWVSPALAPGYSIYLRLRLRVLARPLSLLPDGQLEHC